MMKESEECHAEQIHCRAEQGVCERPAAMSDRVVPASVLLLLSALFGLSLFWSSVVAQTASQSTHHDILILNGRMIDGSGTPWIKTDIAVDGDRITAIGDLSGRSADRTIDASGLYVTPGFIDTHSHASSGLTNPELSAAEPLVAQGVTTVFINPDGGGPLDLTRQQEDLRAAGPGVNVAQFVPHGTVRVEVLGREDRAPDEKELERMKELVRQGMEAGAFGLSTGVFYSPASFAETDELVELSKVAAEYEGVYQSHIRDEADYTIGVVAAVDEVIEIAERAALPGVVTHIKALGPNVWGYSSAMVHRIEQARERGVQVFADQYPYNASSTSLAAALVPRWALEGGMSAFRNRLEDDGLRGQIREQMVENLARRGGAGRIQLLNVRQYPDLEGRTLAWYAEESSLEEVDAAIALLEESSPGIVSFNMNDRDVERLMRQPWTMTASDGGLVAMGQGVPHPRNYGSFPRKIKYYAVEQGVVDLAFAIRSMTHMPALVYGVHDRGMIREGAFADLAIFDLGQLEAPADFQDPHQLAEGMVYVFVNGEAAVEDGELTGSRSGRLLVRERD